MDGRSWSWNWSVIGGKGGNTDHYYGSESAWIRSQSGMDGEEGESCGTVNIYDSINVYAYGGAGGSSGLYTKDAGSSGTGRRRLSTELELGVGGAGAGAGNHIQGGGGYSPGVCEECSYPTQYNNGKYSFEPELYSCGQSGGCYFSDSMYDNRFVGSISWCKLAFGGKAGGQGGANQGTWFKDCAGDGGIAGSGGTVKVSSTAKVYAYNGNECTLNVGNDDYYYTPLVIFGQNGIHREVYKTNQWWETDEAPERSVKYFEAIWGVGSLNSDAYDAERGLTSETARNVLVRDAYNTEPIKYVLDGKTQGIGSGAGYIELSNGTYEVDPALD